MTLFDNLKKRAAEKKEAETTKTIAVQVDDLLSFRQFSKKTADEAIDVSDDSCLIFRTTNFFAV